MSGKKFDIEDRLVILAATIALFCKNMPKDIVGQYYGGQLIRSGGSAALNFGEVQGTNTNRDFVNKSTICLKELKETRVNLKILSRIRYGDRSKRLFLLKEVEELIKIIATIIRNKK